MFLGLLVHFLLTIYNRQLIVDEALIEAFDTLTGNVDNRYLCWKTNSAYKVNKKVIAPATINYDKSYMNASDLKKYGARFSLYNSYNISFLSDLDLVLANMLGINIRHITTIEKALKIRFDELGKIRTGDKFDSTCESTFFKIKFFKVGTLHLEFKSNDLWEQFNYLACIGKKWLPEEEYRKYKKKYKKETPQNDQLLLSM